jgi:uncharacterized membrane protein YedE/YeeE
MTISGFTPGPALLGGVLIGLAAVLLMRLNGRIAGASGILNGAIARTTDGRAWRWAFLLGAVAAGALFHVATGEPHTARSGFPLPVLIMAGFLVGFGTRVGSGCTSGHGVCGVARLSVRSIVATLVFLFAGIGVASLLGAAGWFA